MPLNPYEDSINTGATAAANMSVARGKYDTEPPPPNMTPKEPPRTPTDRAQDAPMPPPPLGYQPGKGGREIRGQGGYTYRLADGGIRVLGGPNWVDQIATPEKSPEALLAIAAEIRSQLGVGELAELARLEEAARLRQQGGFPLGSAGVEGADRRLAPADRRYP